MNALIDMYCASYFVLDARRLFEATVIDILSWNCMTSAYVKIGDAVESIKLFCRMVRESIKPDEVTVAAVFGDCDWITALHFGMSVHSYMVKRGFGANTIVGP